MSSRKKKGDLKARKSLVAGHYNMAESTRKRQKKSKKFYTGSKKGKHLDNRVITTSMRGVLVFGADNEAKARKEAYSILNEYADELFGTEFKEDVTNTDNKHNCSESTDSSDVEDIEKAIAKEVKQIKSLEKTRRFQDIPTGVKAILFIKTTLSKEELNQLVHSILSDIAKTKQNKARSFQRLVPITDICSADLKSINKTVIAQFLPGEHTRKRVKMCVHYKSRFNSSLKREHVLQEISSIFLNVGHDVDLKSPDIIIVVEVMKGLCFMNSLDDFFRFKKYNLHSVVNEEKDCSKDTAKDSQENVPEETFSEARSSPCDENYHWAHT